MKNMLRRNLALLLAVVMTLSCMPLNVLAAVIPVSGETQTSSGISLQSIVRPDDVQVDTYAFTVDGETVSTQKVKQGDTLFAPAAPSKDGYKFIGWEDKDHNAPAFGIVGETDGTEYTFAARFAEVHYVFFMDDQGRVQITREGVQGDVILTNVTIALQNPQTAITGWYADAALTQPVGASVTLADADVTLWPKVEKGYYLTFDSVGGTYYAPVFYLPGQVTVTPGAPEKSGYTFAGWRDANGNAFSFGSALTQDTALTAQWTASTRTSYTVIHWQENADDDGYSFKESETKTGTTGAQTSASAKAYQGFTAQTITQETIKGDGSTIVSVYYKRNVYEVKFYSYSSGIFTPSEEYEDLRITAKYGANISDKWPTRLNSNTWSTSDGGSTYQVNIDTMPLDGASFYGPKTGRGSETAYYYVEVLPGESGTTYNRVTYKEHHHDTSPGTGYTVSKEDKYPITGFTYKEGTNNGSQYNNAKFYYTRNSYDIVFINNGTTVNTVSKKYEQSLSDVAYTPSIPAGMDQNYIFAGWYDNPLGQGTPYTFDGKTMPAQNITVYAKWVAPEVSGIAFKVMAGGDGQTLDVAYGETINPDDMPTPTAPEGEGWEFVAWATKDASGNFIPFNFNTKVYEDIALYPYYVNKNQHIVTYSANGGTGDVADGRTYAIGAEADVKSAAGLTAPAGKVFTGWLVEGTGETKQPGDKLTITGDMTLIAQWGDQPTGATLTYHANGGDGADVTEHFVNNETHTTKPASTFTRTGYTLTGWNTQPDGSGDGFACGASVIIDNNGSNDLYAVWEINQYEYRVEYYRTGMTAPFAYAGPTEVDYGTVINDYEDKCPAGYVLDRTENLPLTVGTDETQNVIRVYYKQNTFTLTIHYVYAGDGQAAADYTASVTYGTDYSVDSPVIPGYNADKPTVAGTMPASDVEVTVTYSAKTDLSYTVRYLWNGTETPVADAKTVSGQTFGRTVTEAPVTAAGYTPVSMDHKSLTISADDSQNVITFYYYKNVVLTANSREVTYNGQPQSVSGYTIADENGSPVDALVFATRTVQAGATGTDAGEYPATFSESPLWAVDSTSRYIVTDAVNGLLKINKADIKNSVHLTTNDAHKMYDGTDLFAPAATAIDDNGGALKIEYSRDPQGTVWTEDPDDIHIRNVATFTMKVRVSAANYDGYVEGTQTLTITQRPVTLTSANDEKTYDGTPLTNHTVTVGGAGFAKGEGAIYTVTGTITDAGSKPNAFTYTLENGTEAKNYSITLETGTLTINPVDTLVTVTVTERTLEVTYNGTERSLTGYRSIKADNELYNDDLKANIQETPTDAWTARGTNAGTYEIGILPGDFKNIDNNFTNVQFKIVDGALTIKPVETPVTVTVTENSDEVTYDGQAHSVYGYKSIASDNALYVVTGDDLAENVEVTPTDVWTATGTNAGTYDLGIQPGDFKNINRNFTTVVFEIVDGALKINPVSTRVVVGIRGNTASHTYDGTAKTVTGYEVVTISNSLYDEENIQLVGTAEAAGTNANKYPMGLTDNSFKNISENFTNVVFDVVEDGKLEITKRPVTLKSETDSKVYDGTPLTRPDVTVGGDGFVAGEVSNIRATGSVTNVAEMSVENTIVYDAAEGFNPDNYAITLDQGRLHITPITAEVIVYLKGNQKTVYYDAAEHTVTGLAEFYCNNNTLYHPYQDVSYKGKTGEEAAALFTVTGKDKGRHDMVLNSTDFANINPNFENVTFVAENGWLEIVRRRVEILVADTGKTYGNPDPAFADATLNFIENTPTDAQKTAMLAELADINLSVYRTDAGDDTVGNHLNVLIIRSAITDIETRYPNYNFSLHEGDFYIRATDETLTVRAEGYMGLYDGQAHGVTAKAYIFNGTETVEAQDAVIKYCDENGEYTLDESPKYKDVRSANVGAERQYPVRFMATLDGMTAYGESYVQIVPRTVVLTSESRNLDYTGQAVSAKTVTATGDGIINDEIYDYRAIGELTNAFDGPNGDGKVTNTIIYSVTTDYNPLNYTLTLTEGELQVNKRTVILTSRTDSKVYDGTPLTRPVVVIETNGFVDGEVVEDSVRATGSVTDVDEGEVVNTIVYTTTGNFDERNYSITKKEGKLSILPVTAQKIQITTATNSKVYDGKALTDHNHTYTGTIMEGDQLIVTYTGSQTNKGSSENTIAGYRVERISTGKDVTGNYTFGETLLGTLTVTARPMTITAMNNTVTYDGQAHGENPDTPYGVEADDGEMILGVRAIQRGLLDGSEVTNVVIPFTATDAGVYTDKLEIAQGVKILQNGTDVTDNYAIELKPGTLVINQRPVTVTAETLEYDYDYSSPVAHPAADVTRYTVNEGLLAGDTVAAQVRYDGAEQQTLIGEYEAKVQPGVKITRGEADVTGNYAITLLPGILRIKGDEPLQPEKETTSVQTNYTVGDKIAYTITVKNVSKDEARNVAVTDNLATLLPGAGYTVSGGVATIASIPAGGEVKVYAEHTVTAEDVEAAYANAGNGIRTNVANVSYHGKTYTVTGDPDQLNDTYEYIVRYYWNTTTEQLAAEKKVSAKVGQEVTEHAITIDGCTAIATGREAKLTIRAFGGDENPNIINFYYYKNVTLTANSATVTYDGKLHTVSGFTGAPADADFRNIEVGAEGTDAGTYPACFDEDTVGRSDETDKYYIVEAQDGKLIINAITDKKITITAGSSEKVYDGQPLTDASFTYTENVLVAGDRLEAVVAGSALNVGDAGVNQVVSYRVLRGTRDVTANYAFEESVNGKLTITKRPVTLTSQSDSKVYDGTALTKPGVTVDGKGFVLGEMLAVEATGSVTYVTEGEVSNTISLNPGRNYQEGNYDITRTEGTLKIEKRAVTITANDHTVEYDGGEHGGNGYKHDAVIDQIHHSVHASISFTAVNAGTYTDKLALENAVIRNDQSQDVTANFEVTLVPGTLTILKRGAEKKDVVIRAEDNTVTYDGQPHGAKTNAQGEYQMGLSYTMTRLAFGHMVQSLVISGSQTNVGVYEGELKPSRAVIVDQDGQDVTDNYEIVYENGKLTISAMSAVVVTVRGNRDTVEYDGQQHAVDGYTFVSATSALYEESFFGLKRGVQAHAEGTDAGHYPMHLTGASFENLNGNFTNVTFVVEDGGLTITKRGEGENKVTITANDNTVEYDGQPHGENGYTSQNLAQGHSVKSVVIDGSRTNAGEYAGVLVPHSAQIVDENGRDVTRNYALTYVAGNLTITKRGAGENKVTITANDNTVEYDGQPHGENGYTSQNLAQGHRVNTVAIDGSRTNAGVYTGVLVPHDAQIVDEKGHDVTDNYEITYVANILTITKRALTIAAAANTVDYDGKGHGPVLNAQGYMEKGLSYTLDRLAQDHDVRTIVIDGNRTLVGKYENELNPHDAVIVDAGRNDVTDNYEITYEPADLEIRGDKLIPDKQETGHTKETDPKYQLGDQVTFSITVKNVSIYDVENVEVTDATAQIQPQSGVTVSENGTKAVIARVAAGQQVVLTALHTVTEEDLIAGEYTNTADVKFEDKNRQVFGKADDFEELKPEFTITKELTNLPEKGFFTVGETAQFTITVNNTGNTTLTQLTLTEELAGAAFVPGDGYQIVGGKAVIQRLAPGQEAEVKAEYEIQPTDLGKGTMENLVTGEGKGPGKDPEPGEGGTEFEVDDVYRVNAIKVWEDEENKHETRPASITFVLTAAEGGENAREIDSKTATAETDWRVSFENLPAHSASGMRMDYSLSEITVDGYDTAVSMEEGESVVEGDEATGRRIMTLDGIVTNTLRSHTLTIRYWVEAVGGEKAFDTYEKDYYYNEQYNVVSPGMYGYEPTAERVAGRMPDEDRVIDVVYIQQSYKLTIYYIFEDGTTAHKEYQKKLYAGDKFEVESPEINGYKPNLWMISGTMPDRDLNYTVIYIARTKPVEIQEAVVPLGVGSVAPNTGDCFD